MTANLFLAQTPSSLWVQQASQGESHVLWFIVGFIAVILVIVLIQRGVQSGSRRPSTLGRSATFNRGSFRRAARGVGLAEEETRFLEGYGKALGVSNPEFLFRNQSKLDSFFKEVYRYIEKNSESEGTAEDEKARLFAAREMLTRQNAMGRPVTSTRQLGRNLPLTFIAPGEESYPSVIVAVEPGGIAVEPVRDPYGEAMRFRKGTKLSCYFYTSGHQGYQYPARVVGWERIGTKEVMVLSHSDTVSALPARRNARREMKSPCSFFRVMVNSAKSRGKTQTTARVENIPFPGTIIDISAGGVGIQSANPLQAGEFLKIEFNPDGASHAAFGKVVRMNRLRAVGGIMHIQFVRISRRTLNSILSQVYGYAD
ncbi:MAG TPA: PilZ domain-containing protein [Rectinemataceae bacterium]|nr:PilZ domain-containing protein [Rectinemataceae bacterium]